MFQQENVPEMGPNKAIDSDKNNVTWRLKAGMVKRIYAAITRKGLGKHVPVTTDTHATIELLEAVFSMQSVSRIYKEGQRGVQ
jgi:hypothetical protein